MEGIIGNGEELLQQQKHMGQEAGNKVLEMIFMYATIWATAGALLADKQAPPPPTCHGWSPCGCSL